MPNVSTEMVKQSFKGYLRLVQCLVDPDTAAVTSAAIQAHSGFSEYFQSPSESAELGIERFKTAVLTVATRLESAFESVANKLPGANDLSEYYELGAESGFWGDLLTERDKRQRQEREEGEAQVRSEQATISSASVPGSRHADTEEGPGEPDPGFWEAKDREDEEIYRQSLRNVGEKPTEGY